MATARITATLEGEVTIDLGDEARAIILREQIRALHFALADVKQEEALMPAFEEPDARSHLEGLGAALDRAQKAADALWHLAPPEEGS